MDGIRLWRAEHHRRVLQRARCGGIRRQRETCNSGFPSSKPCCRRKGPISLAPSFSMVDAVFGPVFRYFDVLESAGETGFFDGLPKVRAWRAAPRCAPFSAAGRGSGYAAELHRFFLARGSELSRRIADHED
jgi:glutathione S-transferase